MTDTPARLRGAVDAVMAHQWSHSCDAMQALTDLVDAAAAGADELARVHAERDESAVEVVRLIGLIDDLTVERDILRRDNDNHRAERERLSDALRDAADRIEDWCAYAGAYFDDLADAVRGLPAPEGEGPPIPRMADGSPDDPEQYGVPAPDGTHKLTVADL